MSYKRKIRNVIAWVIAIIILKIRNLDKIIKQYGNDYIFSFYLHNPSKKHFERIIKWLIENNFNFISTKKLEQILAKEDISIPRSVWLSFDDGWKDNIENVIPVLEKYNIPATIFISTKPVERGFYWFSFAKKNRSLFNINIKKLWSLPDNKRKEIIENSLKNLEPNIEYEAMTAEEIKTISQNSLITIGNHTDDHVILLNCTEDEIKFEINEAKRKLEEITQKEINIFAYPNGDYDERVIEIIKDLKINLAATTEQSFINLKNKPYKYKVPRIMIMDDGSLKENLCHMFGLWQSVIKILKN